MQELSSVVWLVVSNDSSRWRKAAASGLVKHGQSMFGRLASLSELTGKTVKCYSKGR